MTDTKWILEDGEQEGFDERKERFNEVCVLINSRKIELRKIQNKQTALFNSVEVIKQSLFSLSEERDQLEKYLIKKHKKLEVFSLNKMEILQKLKSMNNIQQYNYLMKSKNDWILFQEIIK